MSLLRTALLTAALTSASSPVLACAVCANGAPILRAETGPDAKVPRFHLTLDTKIGRVRSGDAWLDDRRVELAFAFAPVRGLELSLDMPALHRTVHVKGLPVENALTAGDVELRATGTLFRSSDGASQQLALTGGTKLPTAPNERDAVGRPLSSILQPGCNAVTPSLGVIYGLSKGMWGLSASASFYMPIAVRKAPHTAESLRTTIGVAVSPTRWLTARSGFATRYDPSGELHPGIGDPDSGGFVGSLVEELAVTPAPALTVSAGVYSPVLQALHGRQHVGNTFAASVTARF